jgi:hypothetical protein
MEKKNALALRLEFIWLLFTLLAFCLIAAPVYLNIPEFPFFAMNLLFVAVFITASRYIFLLSYTPLARIQILKVFFFFASIPLIFFLVSQIQHFKTFLDEIGIQSLMGNISLEEETRLTGYIQTEMLFFGVGSVIATAGFAMRMILSVWRLHNRGTV